ncbi:5-dehydro-2-deoxygluconokinase [Tropicimonas sp. IMCC34043]|uniref:5-dehydro-2-deoxygluconokinase n=1 Tax=Tropicimonas sp. IMCC34043 TaxID=2248760 RepID=UPI000E249FA4|nr:5-dehydro-2-deoxygluconokinase [Tropicimonas sp. IMCC34043]
MSQSRKGFAAAVPDAAGRQIDLICIGRGIADLYADQLGGRLEDAISFSAYIGGSATNICVGVQRLGLRTAMILRVGDDHMGRLVRETLQRNGVDTRNVIADPKAPTPLCILGVRDSHTFPRDLFTEGGAYLNLCEEDLDADLFASSRALLINGSFFATEALRRASRKAIRLARESGCALALDVDYRPALWGLVGHGSGEAAYVESRAVTEAFAEFVPEFDLIVGTEEEIAIVGGARDDLTAVRTIRGQSDATIVLKRGPLGCVSFDGDIPEDIELGLIVPGFGVEVMNTAGAGDSFMAGLAAGWLNGKGLFDSCRIGNACGAINVARHGCSDSAPSDREIAHFMAQGGIRTPDDDARMRNLHATLGRQDKPVPSALLDARAAGRPHEAIAEALAGGRIDGLLWPATESFGELAPFTGRRHWIARAVEIGPGLADGIRLMRQIRAWPREHVIWLQGDAVEDAAVVAALAAIAAETRHELLIDLSDCADPLAIAKGILSADIRPEWWMTKADIVALQELLAAQDVAPRGVIDSAAVLSRI